MLRGGGKIVAAVGLGLAIACAPDASMPSNLSEFREQEETPPPLPQERPAPEDEVEQEGGPTEVNERPLFPPGFAPIACPEPGTPLPQYLCEEAYDPEGRLDEINIRCAIETACLGEAPGTDASALRVMAYNIERGEELDAQLNALVRGEGMPMPDILLLSEADRDCVRSGFQNVALRYAEALQMNMVFGVEFVELERIGKTGEHEPTCEHGNAVLSRFPLGNARVVRHDANRSWHGDSEEPRLGGRMYVTADVLVGAKVVHVSSVHFESEPDDALYRAAQAEEVALDGVARQADLAGPVVIGGDMNVGTYVGDLTLGTTYNTATQNFFASGFRDTHENLSVTQRITKSPGLVLDLLMVRDAATSEPGLCPDSACGFSDHAPVWTTLHLED